MSYLNSNEKLKELLEDARNNVDFYKSRIPNNISLFNTAYEIKDLLCQLPIVDKAIIKSNYLSFISNTLKKDRLTDLLRMEKHLSSEIQFSVADKTLWIEYTSGTSGTPFLSIKSMQERFQLARSLWKLRRNACPTRLRGIINFNNPEEHRQFTKQVGNENGDQNKLYKELECLANSNYEMWLMNSSKLDNYKAVLQDKPLMFPKLKIIENGGSFITKEEQAEFEELFKCPVSNYYGCTEVWAIAYSCQYKYLHLAEDTVCFELVDTQGNVITEPNKIGYVVLTSYNQKIMPFIRYRLDDMAYYVKGRCQCHANERRIELVPNRNMILGTNLYGNRYFRNVILKLVTVYRITKFKLITVVQIEKCKFIVNITQNGEEPEVIEEKFIQASNLVFGSNEYTFIFTYDDDLKAKSIFTLSKALLKNLTSL